MAGGELMEEETNIGASCTEGNALQGKPYALLVSLAQGGNEYDLAVAGVLAIAHVSGCGWLVPESFSFLDVCKGEDVEKTSIVA